MSSGAGTLGKYQIIREIARSNDIVYEAYDPAMNRRVALKELAVPGGSTEKQRQERLARFQREAKAAGSLAHPNIVTIYEVGEDNGRAFIAMEYLEGQTLRQRIDVDGAIEQDEAVRILLEVLDGLAYAHEKGVVHRDIKPDNIQLLPDKRVKITDFGIARLMFEPSLTMDGQIFGTPSYMSPEQVVGREIDAHTDIWSCGVVLYEAIAGKKPFAGDSVVTISHAIMHLEPPDPAHASYSITQVIKRAIDKAPSERFASAKAMSKALREAMDSLHSDSRIAPTFQPAPGATYLPTQSPWGPPLDPYAQSTPPPIPSGPPTPYGGGVPPVYNMPGYGQPYGQAYGVPAPQQMPPPIPYPPGWVSPPPRKPWVSEAAAEFIRRTLIVTIIGSLILLLGFLAIANLSRASEKRITEPSEIAQMQRHIDKAADFRNRVAVEMGGQERLDLLQQSAEESKKAIEVAPNPDSKRNAYRSAAQTSVMLAREYLAQFRVDDADLEAQQAAIYANSANSPELLSQAAALQQEINSRR